MGDRTAMRTPRQCAALLKTLADETRLRLLESLLVRDKCVSELVRELRCVQPHVSHHLRILRDSGLVEGHRDGKQVCYRVSPTIRRALPIGRERLWISDVASSVSPRPC